MAIGLSAILVSSPVAYELVRYAGAAYLVYLGVRMLVVRTSGKATGQSASSKSPSSPLSVFRQGATTNVLNPKVALFFLAFLPQFADQSRGSVAMQIILLGLLFDTSGTSVNMKVAVLAGHVSDSLRSHSAFSRLQEFVPASILIALGLLVALS